MYRSPLLPRCAGIALACLFTGGLSAHANLIPWSYNWEPSAAKINAAGGGSGWIALTDEPNRAVEGSSNTVVTNLRTFSTATQSAPDTFNHAAYTFTLQLKDTNSRATGSLTFSGFFSGLLTDSNANLQNTLTSPPTQHLSLGGNTYSVSIGTYSPPGPPGAINAGSLNAFVTVAPGTTGGSGGVSGTPSGTPEPSTLTLAALALPCVGLAGWRRRQRSLPFVPSLVA
jgi:hypothetical protein